ncbi:MAG: hypothetical protein ABIH63_03295 [archaeon]
MQQLEGRDRFDRRSDIIRTLYEGALLITTTALPKDKEDKIYVLYKDGFLEWVIKQENNGISNYSEDANLTSYSKAWSRNIEDFVNQKLKAGDTIGFLVMDRPTLYTLMGLREKQELDKEYLTKWGIGIRKK